MKRNDSGALALGEVASIKVQAGERMVDVYNFAATNNITVVGGGEVNVGIGGWISHGGHGPVSAYYGMGADQVLEMEVVTADGVLRVVNEKSDPDLFWALRGVSGPQISILSSANTSQGGASNFAVIISVTMKAYDILPYTEYQYSYNTTAKTDTFWSMAAYFHTQLPRLVKSGLMGYFWVTPLEATSQDSSTQGRLYGTWYAPELALHEVQDLLAPMEAHLKASEWQDHVSVSGRGAEYAGYMKKYARDTSPGSAGIPVRLGSWLLDEKALSKPTPVLEKALRGASDDLVDWPILGHVIAGPGTWSPKGGIAGGSNAVLPAWRTAYMQIGKSLTIRRLLVLANTLKSSSKIMGSPESDSEGDRHHQPPQRGCTGTSRLGSRYGRVCKRGRPDRTGLAASVLRRELRETPCPQGVLGSSRSVLVQKWSWK